MTLMTAHRILIGTAVVFFLLYAGWEIRHAESAPWALVRGGLATAAAVGFGLYLRSLGRS